MIFHEKIMKIMKKSWFSWFSWFFMIFMIFSWFFMIFMIFSWKIKIFQKVQKFSHSIWKVPKMFCHLEIHWGALGRRNIDHEASGGEFLQNLTFFKNNDTLAAPTSDGDSHVAGIIHLSAPTTVSPSLCSLRTVRTMLEPSVTVPNDAQWCPGAIPVPRASPQRP